MCSSVGSGMSRMPWPLPSVSPPGTPAILGFSKPLDDQYDAPGMSPHSGIPLPPLTLFTPIPNCLGRNSIAGLPSPMSANAPPREVPSFVNRAESQLQNFRSPFGQIATSFSYARNDWAPYGLTETIARTSSTTGGAPGCEDPALYSGVPPFIEAVGFCVDSGRPSPKGKERDLIQLVSNLRGLVTLAEHSANQILNLAKLALSPSDNLNHFPTEVTSHQSLPHPIPQETLNAAAQTKNSSSRQISGFHIGNTLATETDTSFGLKTSTLTSTIKSFKTNGEDVNEELTRTGIIERALELGGSPRMLLKSSNLLKEMIKYLNDQYGHSDNFFYEDAPAVVQVPANPGPDDLVLPDFAIEERWAEFAPWMEVESYIPYRDECKSLLPSRYWLLKKELGSWKCLPLQYTSTQLEAAVALARLKRKDLRKRLLTFLPCFDVALDRHLVNHILFLFVFCLRAVHREAKMISSKNNVPESRDREGPHVETSNRKGSAVGVDRGSLPHTMKDASRNFSTLQAKASVMAMEVVEARALFDSGGWLVSQLSHLYGTGSSKNLVLGLYKQALEDAGHSLAFSDLQAGSEASSDTLHPGKISRERTLMDPGAVHKSRSSGFVSEDGEQAEPKAEGLASSGCGTVEGAGLFSEVNGDRKFANDAILCDGALSLWQIAEAIAAIQARAALEETRKAEPPFLHLSQSQRTSIYDSMLKLADEEHAKRTNYRAVLEHDGLTWQRQLNQNSKKNKTKEEILADERDYKRRRMSYRGKKVQRTPSQVLHDIIEGHMEEIVAAGGIGCFGRRLQELPALQMETEPSGSLPLQASYGRSDVFVDEQRPAAYRKYFDSNDGYAVRSRGHSHLQEMSSSEVSDRRFKASHLESSKHSKYRTPDKHEHKTADEKHRQDRGRSVSTSYSSGNFSYHDRDKLDSHAERRHRLFERSHDDNSGDSLTREHDSSKQFDRWESKLDEKDELGYFGEQLHCKHWSSSEVEKGDHREPQEERDGYRRSHGKDRDKHWRSHSKNRDAHRRSYDESYHSRHRSGAK